MIGRDELNRSGSPSCGISNHELPNIFAHFQDDLGHQRSRLEGSAPICVKCSAHQLLKTTPPLTLISFTGNSHGLRLRSALCRPLAAAQRAETPAADQRAKNGRAAAAGTLRLGVGPASDGPAPAGAQAAGRTATARWRASASTPRAARRRRRRITPSAARGGCGGCARRSTAPTTAAAGRWRPRSSAASCAPLARRGVGG